jgi:phosphate transport system protein
MSVHLAHEIDRLKQCILHLGAMVEENLRRAVQSIRDRNAPLARKVIEADTEIDRTEVDVEEECLKVLALHQPVAVDLRFIIAILKINNDLERIGDLAVNIAERAEYLVGTERIDPPFDLVKMAAQAQSMVKRSLDALVERDAPLAYQVCADDEEVDAINRSIYPKATRLFREQPDHIDALMHHFTVARQLERIADHATNIAEDVIYMLEGEIVRHQPDKYGPR